MLLPFTALVVAAVPAFVASVVEWVEAFTIVLAVGNTRGWRAPLWGLAGGVVSLAVIVAAFGPLLVLAQDQITQTFHILIGLLLLLFGMRWLRKSILRFAGLVAEHDEQAIYARQVARLGTEGAAPRRWDNVGFWMAYKALLLEGLEVVFIVITLGAQGGQALAAATLGAVGAFVLVLTAGALIHRPLAFVPENLMKFVVGVMLTGFGVFWGAEGLLVEWPLGEATLLIIIPLVGLVGAFAVRMLASLRPADTRQAVSHS